MQVQFSPIPDDDTAAAMLTAIACWLDSVSATDEINESPRSAWRAAGILAAQGLPPSRGATPPKWSTAERTQRATQWSAGIVGM